MMAQRYFDLRDPVNQAATIGRYGQVPPPATPQLNHVSAGRTYITWMAKTNLAPMRDQGNSCLKIYFIFLLIYSWYSDPYGPLTPYPPKANLYERDNADAKDRFGDTWVKAVMN